MRSLVILSLSEQAKIENQLSILIFFIVLFR